MTASPDTIPTAIRRGPITWLGALTAAGGAILALGPPGALVAGLLAILWTRLSTVAVAAIGQLALVVLVPEHAPPARVLLIESGFIGMLAGTAYHVDAPRRTMAAVGIAVIGLTGVTWSLYRWTTSLPIGGVALAATVAIAAYGMHRYETVTLTGEKAA